MFRSFLAVFALISLVSALASPHMSHAVHRHRSLSARIPAPVAEPLVDPQPVLPKRTRSRRHARRANSGRCKVGSSSSLAQASSTPLAQQTSSTTPLQTTSVTPESTSAAQATSSTPESTVAPATSSTPESTAVPATSATPESTSTSSFVQEQHTSSSQETQPVATTTTTTTPQTTPTTSSAQATSTSGSSDGTTYTGEITYYERPMETPMTILFVASTSISNATDESKSTDVKVVDRCTGCAEYDLDLSPAAFEDLASESVGRLQGATWYFTS
ncbi:uncharacterized protein BT62DRAFT_916854 [Guyanagaster necrorhizus]|uniref:RlpA-like protein double-psi beta-barrel domain-containing protein n=1 Tax=Guyanagaster necrorhizus TaxID=856835 RepID=A0A9P7W0D9_9AGAR|nr:uncharacterized protein BT62DRAFT_916854 [Guyanagaster necrorhizus MCA 3950]KAG7450433.1 hypothetical protein BT62DRAFT_916854 [Guyanagaster necrorhizus MCA 3950]